MGAAVIGAGLRGRCKGLVTMGRKFAAIGLAVALTGAVLAAAVVPSAPTQAASAPATFVVPANDGYGIGECVSTGSACAKVVADSWCEAQGYARPASYGVVADVEVTGSVSPASDRPISITCAE